MTQMNSIIKELPRGGYLVTTSEGVVQIGVPPETIKDSMVIEEGVPQIFVLPLQFFHLDKGISLAEIEFPIYYNFFLKKKKTRIICLEERINDLKAALTEALFGPENIDISNEYFNDEVRKSMPDFKKELAYFRRGLELDSLIEFDPYIDNVVKFGNVQIILNRDNSFTIKDKDDLLAKVSGDIKFYIKYDTGTLSDKPFEPPMMGVTCLGPSHGFDPTQNTSGFLVWLNGSGIMIDPPVNTTEWLERSNVNPKLIDSIILTHCHADHDAGTFQKILEEQKIKIYTTKTIMASFLKKYSSLTKLPIERLEEMFHFNPVIIGKEVSIHGGMFSFFYTLHAIPTVGFKARYKGKSMVYSSDHLNDPELFKTLYEENIFSKERMEQLLSFPWDCDLIYHEAGIPPIHTRIDYLNTLPDEVRKKMIIYHISAKDFPKDSLLTLATFGIGNTILLPTKKTRYDEANRVLHIFDHLEQFRDVPLYKIRELLSVVDEEHYKPDEVIIEKGTVGNKFYIIIEGKVKIEGLENSTTKTYEMYETFGETSLLFNKPRAATVIAKSEVTALVIERSAFLSIIEGTQIESNMIRLSEIRDPSSWNLLLETHAFKNTTAYQKTSFESILISETAMDGEIIIHQDKPLMNMYLIKDGYIKVMKDDKLITSLKRGMFAGDILQLQKRDPSECSYIAEGEVSLYKINWKDMSNYIDKNPNVYMALIYH